MAYHHLPQAQAAVAYQAVPLAAADFPAAPRAQAQADCLACWVTLPVLAPTQHYADLQAYQQQVVASLMVVLQAVFCPLHQ